MGGLKGAGLLSAVCRLEIDWPIKQVTVPHCPSGVVQPVMTVWVRIQMFWHGHRFGGPDLADIHA